MFFFSSLGFFSLNDVKNTYVVVYTENMNFIHIYEITFFNYLYCWFRKGYSFPLICSQRAIYFHLKSCMWIYRILCDREVRIFNVKLYWNLIFFPETKKKFIIFLTIHFNLLCFDKIVVLQFCFTISNEGGFMWN